MHQPHITSGCALLAAALIAMVSGCASPTQRAEDTAKDAVRAKASSLQERLASAARTTSGAARLDAVRDSLPVPSFLVTRHGGDIVVTGALTATAETGGGLTDAHSIARLCLTYTIQTASGRVTVVDAPCPTDADVTAPADHDVHRVDP